MAAAFEAAAYQADAFEAGGGGGAITATLAVTEADDSLSAVAAVVQAAQLAAGEGADTLTAAGSTGPAAALAATEADDGLTAAGALTIVAAIPTSSSANTLDAAGAVQIAAALAVTEAADTLLAEGGTGGTIASVVATEAADTLAAAGALTIGVALAAGEAADALAAAAALRQSATATLAEAADSLAATGSTGSGAAITAALAVTERGDVVHSYALVGAGARMSIREAALGAIAARLAGELGIPVERGRRSPIGLDEALPRLVLTMGGHEEQEGDQFQTTLLRCTATVEGYCTADTDAALEAAINDLHGRCAAALLGVELMVSSDTGIMIEGRGLVPEAALLDASAEEIGGFTWTIAFDLRASYAAGPFILAAA